MKKIGIIPARMASSRFPGKPLHKIGDKTILERVYIQASQSKLDQVIIATSDIEILEFCIANGLNSKMTAEKSCGTDRCAECIEGLLETDLIINIQGDEPFVQPEQINAVIDSFPVDILLPYIATLIVPISPEKAESQNCVKVVKNSRDFALYFSRSKIPLNGPFRKHIGIYGFQVGVLSEISKLPSSELAASESLEQLRWLDNGYLIRLIETDFDPISINDPEDLLFCV